MHRFGTRGGKKASGQQSIPDCGKCPLNWGVLEWYYVNITHSSL